MAYCEEIIRSNTFSFNAICVDNLTFSKERDIYKISEEKLHVKIQSLFNNTRVSETGQELNRIVSIVKRFIIFAQCYNPRYSLFLPVS